MQHRMKEHPLTREQIAALLDRAPVGSLATLGPDGAPYGVPVHFARLEDKLYIHGLPAGDKVENVARDGRVCLTVWEMEGYILPENEVPCDVNTVYKSVVVKGTACLLEPGEEKEKALLAIVKKLTPQLAGNAMPPAVVKGTAVIRVTPAEVTGKYYG